MSFFRPTVLPIDAWYTPDRGYATMRITSPYGEREDPLGHGTVFHGGLDIGNARLGDKVCAIGAGFVVMASREPLIPWSYPSPPGASWDGPSYGGRVIVIRHAGGRWSQYAHLAEMLVQEGEDVARGQIIGRIGETGSAQGQGHLHFGIRDADRLNNGHNGWVDPWPLLDPISPWEDPVEIAELRTRLRECQETNEQRADRINKLEQRRDALMAELEAAEAEVLALEPLAAQVPILQEKLRLLRTRVKRLRAALEEERNT